MEAETRADMMECIKDTLPKTVFNRFVIILTTVEEKNNNKLVSAIYRLCTHTLNGFAYLMDSGAKAEDITPIREILDLLEGWIITSTIVPHTSGRVKWDIKILDKESEK